MPGSHGTAATFRRRAKGNLSPARSASVPKHSIGKSPNVARQYVARMHARPGRAPELGFTRVQQYGWSKSATAELDGADLWRRPGMTSGDDAKCMPHLRNLPVVPICRGLL